MVSGGTSCGTGRRKLGARRLQTPVHAELTEAQGVTAGFSIVEAELSTSVAVRAGLPRAAGAAMCESK